MKGADKFCVISLWSFWRQIDDSLLVVKIGQCDYTANGLPTFSPQTGNLEIGPSERLFPIFGTKNRILKIASCERAFRMEISWQQNKTESVAYQRKLLLTKLTSRYQTLIVSLKQQPKTFRLILPIDERIQIIDRLSYNVAGRVVK